jgi:hypothetical protein
MAIQVKTKPDVKMGDPTPSPHGEAAATVDHEASSGTVVGTQTDLTTGETSSVLPKHDVPPPPAMPQTSPDRARVKMASAFKWPVADYTMLEWMVGVEIPCDLADVDEAADQAKAWIEERLNALIEENQSQIAE